MLGPRRATAEEARKDGCPWASLGSGPGKAVAHKEVVIRARLGVGDLVRAIALELQSK